MSNNSSVKLDEADDTLPVNNNVLLITALLFLINFAVVFGNLLVIVSITTSKQLQTLHNYLILSLSMTDFLLGLFVIPFQAVSTGTGRWPFLKPYCNMHFGLDVLLSTASILHLCVIAIERYIAIVYPTRYKTFVRTIVPFGITSSWAISACLAQIVIFFPSAWHNAYWEAEGIYDLEGVCITPVNFNFAFFCGLFAFYIPEMLIVFAYGRMYVLLKEQFQRISRSRHQNVSTINNVMYNGFPPGGEGNFPMSTVTKKSLQKEAASMKLMVAVLLSFTILWLPFSIVNPIVALCPEVPAGVFLFSAWCGYANSLVNPILYAMYNKEFRRAFQSLICNHSCYFSYTSRVTDVSMNTRETRSSLDILS